MTKSASVVLFRFIAAGVVNTIFGFSIYAASILLGAEKWLALLIGMLSGVAFNFLSMGGFVFRDLVLARLPRFIAAYFFLFSVNFAGLELVNYWVQDEIVGQIMLTPPMAAISYFALSRLVFLGR